MVGHPPVSFYVQVDGLYWLSLYNVVSGKSCLFAGVENRHDKR